ncbi:hypothetical protein B7C62_29575 [Kitasatospora albolonga]|uniref:Uncharacterized protein n=1 Tax=Kitasatospora albolonga TaxID=68173 RepID=A0ABC8C0T1_9ACTN|nr:hypothetical protein B7C62_29575 [Kitasatospora albolonga]
MPTQRRVQFMCLQGRCSCLLPSLSVDLSGQRSSVVEDKYRVVRAEITPGGLLLQDRRQLTADGNTPYGTGAVRILLAALLCLRADHEPTGAVVPELHVSHAQHPGLLRAQSRESDGSQEGSQGEAVLRIFADPVQDREALPIGQIGRLFIDDCGHGRAP